MPHVRFALATLVAALLLVPGALPREARADAAAWRKNLTGDADRVVRAVQRAQEAKDPTAALPLLEAGIATPHPHIAVACGDALAALEGWPGDKEQRDVEKAVARASKSKDDREQMNLARVLGAWGHPLVDEPLAYLASGRRAPEVQAEALFMAGDVTETEENPFPATRKEILKALDGRTPMVRMAAASAAGRRRVKDAVEDLVSIVRRDREDYPGLYAVWALRQIGYDGGIGTFLHVLGSNPHKSTRNACLKAVTELSAPSDVEDLLSLTRQGKTDYQDAGALGIAHMAARGRLKDANPTVLATIVDRLVSMVGSEDDWEVRDAARQALIYLGPVAKDRIAATMPGLVDFSKADVRLTAIELCGLHGVAGAVKALVKTAVFDDDSVARMFAARALEGAGAEAGIAELAEHARASRGDQELRAIRALGYVRHPKAFDLLLEVVANEKKSDSARREGEYALERLTGHRFGRSAEVWRKWYERDPSPLHLRTAKFDRGANRRDALKTGKYGLEQSTESAVETGLRWLELQQHPEGFWDGNEKGFGGVVHCEPAYTGLALLAFLGAGYQDDRGKYRETVRRAAEFLAATQFYDGGFPVTGGGDNSWIYAYLIAMAVWGLNENFALSGTEAFHDPAQWGVDYLVRVQTPGAGWRYGPRYIQSDTSCTSWVLMTLKTADLSGLHVAQRSIDGIDAWLEACTTDLGDKVEAPEDLKSDHTYEVGSRQYYKFFTGYFTLSGSESSSLQQTSMTAVGMVCRFFMGWKRSHPYMIGSANYLGDYLPQWMKGLEKGQAIAWYHYYWYYGTLAMYAMGGRHWRQWNDRIKKMYVENQRLSPPELVGSWDPDTAVLNGGRIFSTAMSILTLETYYRFSPVLDEGLPEDDGGAPAAGPGPAAPGAAGPAGTPTDPPPGR
jgi:HEAT repeat protein